MQKLTDLTETQGLKEIRCFPRRQVNIIFHKSMQNYVIKINVFYVSPCPQIYQSKKVCPQSGNNFSSKEKNNTNVITCNQNVKTDFPVLSIYLSAVTLKSDHRLV